MQLRSSVLDNPNDSVYRFFIHICSGKKHFWIDLKLYWATVASQNCLHKKYCIYFFFETYTVFF